MVDGYVSPYAQSDSQSELHAENPFDIGAKLEEIYADKMLNGSGCDRTACWFRWWEKVVRLLFSRDNLPGGNMRRKFVDELAKEVGLVANCLTVRDSVERTSRQKDVRLTPCGCQAAGAVGRLPVSIPRCGSSELHELFGKRSGCSTTRQRRQEHDHTVRVFPRPMLQGKLPSAVRWITERH